MTNIKEKINYYEVTNREFNTNTLDKISAHVRLNFSKENIPDNFLVIATIFEEKDFFEGVILKRKPFNAIKTREHLHLTVTKNDLEIICKTADVWRAKEGFVVLDITTL